MLRPLSALPLSTSGILVLSKPIELVQIPNARRGRPPGTKNKPTIEAGKTPRLPQKRVKPTTGRMVKFLDQLGISRDRYYKYFNVRDGMTEFFKMNPTWNMQDWGKMVVENKEKILNNE